MTTPTEYKINMAILNRKTRPDEIEWRVMRAGRTASNKLYCQIVPYRTARSIYDQLDEAVGKENWSSQIEVVDGGVICRIGIYVKNQWVYKSDGAPFTEIEPFKGAISDAHKRTAVLLGIGRDLYQWPTVWADVSSERQKGREWRRGKLKDGTFFWWKAPAMD